MQFRNLLYWLSRPLVLSYTHFMLQMDTLFQAPLPDGPKIIAANHPSTTDPFFLAAMLRQQSFILIKDVLFQVPIFGRYLRASGHIPVLAGCGQGALNEALQRLREGSTVVIFPEGSISQAGGFNPARSGVGRLALASGAPVIPVGIHLDRQHLHLIRSTVRGQAEIGAWYFNGPYNLTSGRPLQFSGDPENRPLVRATSERVMHHIIELARQSELRMDPAGLPLPKVI
jgi:1-acyl-sn-glycerol-3-phosphate acyltransferase